jgi:uncharacterized protein (TIGR03790 family)
MILFRLLLFCTVVIFLGNPSQALTLEDNLKDHLLVVFNHNAEESEALARYYAAARGIPEERVLGLFAPADEEIDRTTYNDNIRDPIIRYLVTKGWLNRQKEILREMGQNFELQVTTKNDIWAIVLMRGVPLKIAQDDSLKEPTPKKAELATNAAAVDSELATFPILGLPLAGLQLNPYSLSSYARPFDEMDARRMVMVTRLDGPTANDVRRMIDDSLYAEEFRLTGRAAIDARGITDEKSGYIEGDYWLRVGYEHLRKLGLDVEFDNHPDLFPNAAPWSDYALYFGWYTGTAIGPFITNGNTFVRGAVAYHIHSFSASTVRSPTAAWCGPLINAGAAATMGSVYEPYLTFTPHLDIFIERLTAGYTFAEAAYASQRVNSWMITMLGDPLYRPFKVTAAEAKDRAEKLEIPQADWLELEALRRRAEAKEILPLSPPQKNSSILWEGHADLLLRPDQGTKFSEAADYYSKAMELNSKPINRYRCGWKAAQAYADAEKWIDSYTMLVRLFQDFPADAKLYNLPQTLKKISSQRDAPALPPSLVKYLP